MGIVPFKGTVKLIFNILFFLLIRKQGHIFKTRHDMNQLAQLEPNGATGGQGFLKLLVKKSHRNLSGIDFRHNFFF